MEERDRRPPRRASRRSRRRSRIRPCSRIAATEVQGLIGKLDAARAEVERLFARWQELTAIAAAAPA